MTTEQAGSPETVFNHHLQAVMAHDLPAIMQDYAEDAVILTPQGPVVGKAAIQESYTDFVLPMLTNEFFQNMKTLRQDIVGEIVYLVWEVAGVADLGVDIFVIRDGKIVSQAFAMHPHR